MTTPSQDRVQALIEQGRALVTQAEQALEATDRFFAQQGIDPAQCIEHLRQQGGDAAVEAVHEQARAALQRIEDEVRRDRLHRSAPGDRSRPQMITRRV